MVEFLLLILVCIQGYFMFICVRKIEWLYCETRELTKRIENTRENMLYIKQLDEKTSNLYGDICKLEMRISQLEANSKPNSTMSYIGK